MAESKTRNDKRERWKKQIMNHYLQNESVMDIIAKTKSSARKRGNESPTYTVHIKDGKVLKQPANVVVNGKRQG